MGRMKLPQKNVRWLGALFESLYLALPILSIVNFLSIAVVLYTDIKPFLLEHVPWVTLWMFLLAIASLTFVAVVLTWVFLVPSLWALRGQQMFGKETREEKKGKEEEAMRYYCSRCKEESVPGTLHTCRDLREEKLP